MRILSLKYILFLTLISLFLGCKEGFKELETGVTYKMLQQGDTDIKPQDDEYLLLNISLKNSSDSVLYSSNDNGVLFHIKYDIYAQKIMKANPLKEMFFNMNKGDSMVFKTDPKHLTFITPKAADFSDEHIYCYARLVDMLDYEAYSEWKGTQLKKMQAAHERKLKRQVAREAQVIDSLLDAQGKQYQISSSGIRYIIKDQGSGPYPQEEDSLFYKYKVMYMDGKPVSGILGNSGETIQSLVMGSNTTLKSWQESLMLLQEGGAGRFYIPSALVFGDSGKFGIKPNAVLVADISLVNIKTNKE